MLSISEFFRMFKYSLWRKQLTNLDETGAKRSVKMWATNFYKIFFKNSFITYVSSKVDSCFCESVYTVSLKVKGIGEG